MESDGGDREPKRRGRKPTTNAPQDLNRCWRVFCALRPDLPATQSLQDLCDAMKPYWRGVAPNYTAVSAVLSHTRPASDTFLKALHGASGLAAEGHSHRIWLLGPGEFEETIAGDPYATLQALAVETSGALALLLQSDDATLLMAALGAPATPPKMRVSLGAEMRLRMQLPFDGYVRILSVDLAERPPAFYSLDPWLGFSGERVDRGTRTLPGPTVDPIPVGGEAGDSAIVMIATRYPIEAAWPNLPAGANAPRIAKEVVRGLAWALKGVPAADRHVEVLRFEAYARTSSDDRGRPTPAPIPPAP
jgi:hypothetical protein